MQNKQRQTASLLWSINAVAATARGPVRGENQDAVVLDGQIRQKPGALFLELPARDTAQDVFSVAVVDGMGGYAGGADAGLLAAAELSRFNMSPECMEQIDGFCNNLSRKLLQAGRAWGTPDMGAAFAALAICDQSALVANVGDCRVYRYNEGALGLLSEDDRLAGRSGITQSLGGFEAPLDAHGYREPLDQENLFLLCSDGVWTTLGDAFLQSVCESKQQDPRQIVEEIITACYREKAHDNCSVIAVRLVAQEGDSDE